MKTTLSLYFIILCLSACGSVRVIETHEDGGTLKFRRRGVAKEHREDKAMAEADEHCKRNGFKTYKVESETQDGRFLMVRFKCVN